MKKELSESRDTAPEDVKSVVRRLMDENFVLENDLGVFRHNPVVKAALKQGRQAVRSQAGFTPAQQAEARVQLPSFTLRTAMVPPLHTTQPQQPCDVGELASPRDEAGIKNATPRNRQ
mmetsp:Transcript_26566/g.64519  ORF Transcript_26566/g.64519 Transcript_26566/m.64519 type:complete len:118 (-) Transcript_26566:1292-1645(-)